MTLSQLVLSNESYDSYILNSFINSFLQIEGQYFGQGFTVLPDYNAEVRVHGPWLHYKWTAAYNDARS